MDVYHDQNMWGKGKPETKLTACPLNRSFLWEKQEIFIPAVYTGKAGAVLDVCAKIPTEDMAAFLKKWDYERRMSLRTPEEFEQIDADNPGSREISVEIRLDDTPLIHGMSSSMRWYPEKIVQMTNVEPAGEDGLENNKSAEEWMDAYHCDRNCCWHFTRLSYHWSDAPILSPQKIALTFQADFISVTAGHFTADPSCEGETVKAVHPVTGQEYTLTLHGCEQTRHSLTGIAEKGVLYPEYCRILSYSIAPEPDLCLFSIRDCADGDEPRRESAQGKSSHENGPVAIFMAGKNPSPESSSPERAFSDRAFSDKRAAVSSLHFKPVPEVQWRIVFRIKPKEDMEITFPI